MNNLLITGRPGIGKTTLVRRLAQDLRDLGPAGFFTEEIRESGVRVGFRMETLGGGEGCLAHVSFATPHRVGKYGVDVAGFEAFLAGMDVRAAPLFLIDEIGKMECFSARFVRLVRTLLDSPKPVVATVAQRGAGFIDEVKRRDDVEVIQLEVRNRDILVGELAARIRALVSF